MAVAAELRRQLLRALEAEVPVDDREDDDVVAAGRLHRDGVGRARARRGLALLELDEAVGSRDGGDHAAQPAREGPGHELRAGGKERSAGRRRPARGAAHAVRGLAEASEAGGSPSARSSASAVIRCCSRASEIERSRSSSFSRAPTRSAVMRSRTATSSRRKAMPSCCSRTTASRRRISRARAATASPAGAPLTPARAGWGEGG